MNIIGFNSQGGINIIVVNQRISNRYGRSFSLQRVAGRCIAINIEGEQVLSGRGVDRFTQAAEGGGGATDSLPGVDLGVLVIPLTGCCTVVSPEFRTTGGNITIVAGNGDGQVGQDIGPDISRKREAAGGKIITTSPYASIGRQGAVTDGGGLGDIIEVDRYGRRVCQRAVILGFNREVEGGIRFKVERRAVGNLDLAIGIDRKGAICVASGYGVRERVAGIRFVGDNGSNHGIVCRILINAEHRCRHCRQRAGPNRFNFGIG